MVELRPRFAARRAHVVVDELTGDGPTARSNEPQQIFALSVDTQLLAGPVLRLSEVDRFTHGGIVAKLSTSTADIGDANAATTPSPVCEQEPVIRLDRRAQHLVMRDEG